MSRMVMVEDRGVRVELEDIGEGVSGDYNPKDKLDIPLLRFTVLREVHDAHEPAEDEGYEWEQVDDASYCTQIDARLSVKTHVRLAELIMREVGDEVRARHSVKKLCERLSWINPTWGTKREKRGYVL